MIRVPSKATLRKYGLSEEEWLSLYGEGLCPICERPLDKPVVDHIHVRGFKKMKAEKRRLYVRGIPCNYCNRRRLAKGMNLRIARNIVKYFEAYEARLNGQKK